MSTYTYRITIDGITGAPVVWIDVDGNPSIVQPHHPSAPGGAPWENLEQAEEWAVAACAEFAAAEVTAAAAAAVEEAARVAEIAAAEEDRARLVRIEGMLSQLLAAQTS